MSNASRATSWGLCVGSVAGFVGAGFATTLSGVFDLVSSMKSHGGSFENAATAMASSAFAMGACSTAILAVSGVIYGISKVNAHFRPS